MEDEMVIKLEEHGDSLGPRVLGRKIKERVLQDLASRSDAVVVFDFTGVSSMSTGFAKELFGELRRTLESSFKQRVRFRFGDNKRLLTSAIARGLRASMKRGASAH